LKESAEKAAKRTMKRRTKSLHMQTKPNVHDDHLPRAQDRIRLDATRIHDADLIASSASFPLPDTVYAPSLGGVTF
jgi:hypothetical protein